MVPPPTLFTWDYDPTIDRPRRMQALVAETRQTAWELKRDPPRQHDLRLTSLATRWFDDMSEGSKPVALCKRYPRIANRLALAWKDSTLAAMLLDDLLDDRRGGRKGFPPQVRAELTMLAAEVRKRKSLS